MNALAKPSPDRKVVLATAVLNAAEQLDLKQSQLAAVLGMHRTAISRMKNKPELDPESKQGELAVMLIRIYRALFSLMDGDLEWMRHFMQSHNKVTKGVPREQIQTVVGLMSVLQFVDAMRGKV